MFFDPRKLAAPAIPAISAIPGATEDPDSEENSKVAKIAAPPPLTQDEQTDIREARLERAAIMEFDGGLSRQEADAQAKRIVKVYRVLVAMDDQHPRWLTMLGAASDDDARRSAHTTFTPERVLRIEEQQ